MEVKIWDIIKYDERYRDNELKWKYIVEEVVTKIRRVEWEVIDINWYTIEWIILLNNKILWIKN